MNSKSYFLLFISLAILFSFITSKKEVTLYDDKVSLVSNLNSRNFNSQVITNRSKNLISIVHFYTLSDGKSNEYVENFDKLATEFDGMFKIAAMNCAQYKDVCEKQEVTSYPVFKVYPLLPTPVMNYEGKIEPMAIVGFLGKFIPNKVTELNPNNYENFLKERANLPKAVLFTDKKGVPLIFKAVAVSFDVRKFIIHLKFFRKKLISLLSEVPIHLLLQNLKLLLSQELWSLELVTKNLNSMMEKTNIN